MSSRPPTRVPTLTEIVQLPDGGDAPTVPAALAPLPGPPPLAPPAASPAATLPAPSLLPGALAAQRSEEELVERVLEDVQRQLELMLEVKMREVLTPVLNRASDQLVRDARSALASTLRDVVSRAVSQELQRHRER